MDSEKKRLLHPGDLILFFALLIIAGGLLLYSRLFQDPGLTAQISVDGSIVKNLPLDQDGEFPVENGQGGFNLLTVRDGQIWCSQASCPDHLCMKQGKKQMSTETIVCLPNRMVVTILEGSP